MQHKCIVPSFMLKWIINQNCNNIKKFVTITEVRFIQRSIDEEVVTMRKESGQRTNSQNWEWKSPLVPSSSLCLSVVQWLKGDRKQWGMTRGVSIHPCQSDSARLTTFSLSPLRQGCQMAKFDPFLSLDCAGVEGEGRNPRKGRNQILQRSGAEP